MGNGKPHDHPLTDIFAHGIKVYGQETDELIRKIGNLSIDRELFEWWEKEIGWEPDAATVLQKAQTRYAELTKRAEEKKK